MAKSDTSNKSVGILNSGKITKYTPETVTMLLAAFSNAFTVEQACIYAGISKVTFYAWLDKHPDLGERVERAKNQVGFKAKQNVVGAVNKGDIQTSKWWLEKKHSDEFGGKDAPTVNINFNAYAQEQREKYQI